MQGKNFCPLCGKSKGRFIKGFCLQCFLKKNSVVEIPEKIEFEQCTNCGKIRLSGKTLPLNKDMLASLVEKKVKVHQLENEAVHVSVKQSANKLLAKVVVKGIIDSVPLSFEKQVTLEPSLVQCDACMRLSGCYHEAIVQLRGKDRKQLEEVLQALVRSINRQHAKDSLAAVTEIAEKKTGFDLKVGSKKAAQNAVRQAQNFFQAETKQSSKLLGTDKKGRERRRFTFLIRV